MLKLCHVMSCYVLLYYALSCYVISCFVLSRSDMVCYVKLMLMLC